MLIRTYKTTDFPHIRELFYTTVHTICSTYYTAEILNTWAPPGHAQDHIRLALENSFSYVIELNGTIIGFGNIDSMGSLDYLFVHAHYQSQGVGSLLLNCIEKKARSLGLKVIVTEASLSSRFFFEKHSFEYIIGEDEEKSIFSSMQKVL